jgi:hypothetical protein
MPNNAEDYVHRIGRTGRAGAKGTSYSFFTPANGRLARDIIKVLREANQVVPPALEQISATSVGGGGSSELGGAEGAERGVASGRVWLVTGIITIAGCCAAPLPALLQTSGAEATAVAVAAAAAAGGE